MNHLFNPFRFRSFHFTLLLILLAVHAAPALADETPAGWYSQGEQLISERRARFAEPPRARNIILFVGDGMSFGTVTAARIFEGQLRGESGEENLLYFEQFPHTAFAKTYNTDRQSPDSAGTITAMVTGVKTFGGSIAIDPDATYGDCESSKGRELVTLLDIASLAGMGTGVISTTRITHATPAAMFARVPHRRWESDSSLPKAAHKAGCRDIARQLAEYDLGGGIDVVLGGGRQPFMPNDANDPEYPDRRGNRTDGRNLIEEWQQRHPDGRYVWNLEQFREATQDLGGPILGLFEPSHMHYEHDRPDDQAGEPSLTEMTRESIRLLTERSGDNGYFLMVEGGRIDHAHHANNAYRALTDTIEFANAIEAAHELTDPSDTLIVVTADHGHALVFAGYPERGNPMLGLIRRAGVGDEPGVLQLDAKGRPMTTLRYFDGPGWRDGERPDYDEVDPTDPDFRQEAHIGFPGSDLGFTAATHSGEDVPVYATGPGAEVIHGVFEQNAIFHALLQSNSATHKTAESLKGEQGYPAWPAARNYHPEPRSMVDIVRLVK